MLGRSPGRKKLGHFVSVVGYVDAIYKEKLNVSWYITIPE